MHAGNCHAQYVEILCNRIVMNDSVLSKKTMGCFRLCVLLSTLLATGLAEPADRQTDNGIYTPKGFWINEKETVAVHISPCRKAEELCGRITWLKKPRRDNGKLKRDNNNPDPEKSGRLLCGLKVLSGFTQATENRWGSGRIYNPEEGRIYRASLELASNSLLHVRGYILLPVFGKTQIWKRLESPPGNCPGEVASESARPD